MMVPMRQIIARSLRTGGAILLVSALALTGVAVAQTDVAPDASDQSDRAAEHPSDVRRPRLRAGLQGLVWHIAQSIGVTGRDVVEGLADGRTVAEIAESNGSTGAAVVADLMSTAQQRLANAVSQGRIDQQKADELAGRLEARFSELVDTPHPGREVVRDRVRHRVRAHVGRQLASELGLTPWELREALADGATVAQLAADADVDLDAVIARVVESLSEGAQRAVDAGHVTEAAVAKRLEAFEQSLRERLGAG